jgi:hypothetical protein
LRARIGNFYRLPQRGIGGSGKTGNGSVVSVNSQIDQRAPFNTLSVAPTIGTNTRLAVDRIEQGPRYAMDEIGRFEIVDHPNRPLGHNLHGAGAQIGARRDRGR